MAPTCSALGCNSKFVRKCDQNENETPITFHRFPPPAKRGFKDLRQKWLQAIERDGWKVKSGRQHLCSLHFLPTDFYPWYRVARLREEAVPSVFHHFVANNRTNKPKRRRDGIGTLDASKEPQLFPSSSPSSGMSLLPTRTTPSLSGGKTSDCEQNTTVSCDVEFNTSIPVHSPFNEHCYCLPLNDCDSESNVECSNEGSVTPISTTITSKTQGEEVSVTPRLVNFYSLCTTLPSPSTSLSPPITTAPLLTQHLSSQRSHIQPTASRSLPNPPLPIPSITHQTSTSTELRHHPQHNMPSVPDHQYCKVICNTSSCQHATPNNLKGATQGSSPRATNNCSTAITSCNSRKVSLSSSLSSCTTCVDSSSTTSYCRNKSDSHTQDSHNTCQQYCRSLQIACTCASKYCFSCTNVDTQRIIKRKEEEIRLEKLKHEATKKTADVLKRVKKTLQQKLCRNEKRMERYKKFVRNLKEENFITKEVAGLLLARLPAGTKDKGQVT